MPAGTAVGVSVRWFGQAQEREDNRVLALLKDQRGLLSRQLRTEQGLQGCCIEGVRSRGCHEPSEVKRPSNCKIN
jgi:hypothetical protein